MAVTVQRKLTGLKHFPNELDSALNNFKSAGVIVDGKEIVTGKEVGDFKNNVQSNYKSITDKIENDYNTRVAIAKSNAVTTITVGDKTMTILEALIYKQYQLPLLERLLKHLTSQENTSRRLYSERVSQSEKSYQDLAKTANVDKSIIEEITLKNKPELFSLEKKIEALKNNIEFFNREFDAALSEINSITTIM